MGWLRLPLLYVINRAAPGCAMLWHLRSAAWFLEILQPKFRGSSNVDVSTEWADSSAGNGTCALKKKMKIMGICHRKTQIIKRNGQDPTNASMGKQLTQIFLDAAPFLSSVLRTVVKVDLYCTKKAKNGLPSEVNLSQLSDSPSYNSHVLFDHEYWKHVKQRKQEWLFSQYKMQLAKKWYGEQSKRHTWYTVTCKRKEERKCPPFFCKPQFPPKITPTAQHECDKDYFK